MKRSIKVITFLLVLTLCISAISWTLMPITTPTDGNLSIQTLSQIPANTVDVCFLGSSHFYNSINPAILWRETGISAYVLGSSSQRFLTTYYYLRELLKTQTPKLVVLDLYSTKFAELSLNAYSSAYRMPMSLNKLAYWYEFSKNLADPISLLLQLPIYHSRSDDITADDFNKYNMSTLAKQSYLGYVYRDEQMKNAPPYGTDLVTAQRTPMNSMVEEWLTRIIALCNANSIPVLMLEVPFLGCTQEYQMMMNDSMAVSKNFGAQALNLFETLDTATLPNSNDYFDVQHVNYQGSQKVSTWLAQYLQSTYTLPDHRGQAGYERWDQAQAFYTRQVQNTKLQQLHSVDSILAAMPADDILAVLLPQHVDFDDPALQAAFTAAHLTEKPYTPCTLVFENGAYAYPIFYNERSTLVTLSKQIYALRAGELYSDAMCIFAPTDNKPLFVLLDKQLQTKPILLDVTNDAPAL